MSKARVQEQIVQQKLIEKQVTKSFETNQQAIFMTALKSGIFSNFQNSIMQTDISVIASSINSEFLPLLLEKFPNLKEREKLFGNLLDKIGNFEGSSFSRDLEVSTITAMDTNTVKYNDINLLKSKLLALKAQNLLDRIDTTKAEAVIITKAKEVVKAAESAYALTQKLSWQSPPGDPKIILDSQITKLKSLINDAILTVNTVSEQFKLAGYALECRKANLPHNPKYQVDIRVKLSEYGANLDEQNLKCQALQYAEEVYSILCRRPTHHESNQNLTTSLKIQADLWREFGNNEKAKFLTNQAAFIQTLKVKNEPEEVDSTTDLLSGFALTPIMKHEATTEAILNVQKQIQTTVLDIISEQAARGKWIDERGASYLIVDYGVRAYVAEEFLKSALGTLNTTDNYKIALELCFEAINLGIMNSDEKNPLCAVIFCNKYPQVIDVLQTSHPEYFIDGYILQNAVFNANAVGKKLTNQDIEANEGYNKHFEKAAIPFIKARCEDKILTPVREIAKKGDWSTSIESYLLSHLTDDYIIKVMGQNFTTIKDVFNIVRILAFKEMSCAIEGTNFSCITAFNKAYSDLLPRINIDHSDALDRQFVKELSSVNYYVTANLSLPTQEAETHTTVDLTGENTESLQ